MPAHNNNNKQQVPLVQEIDPQPTEPPAPTATPSSPLTAALEESVRRQVAAQLSAESPIGRQLTRQFSAYFGEPVAIRANVGRANSPPLPSSSRRPEVADEAEPSNVVAA